MSVMRRRLMMAPPRLGYIQDGLLLHLDGIWNTRRGHAPAAAVWEDMSGNGWDAALHGTVQWMPDGADFAGNSAQAPIYFDSALALQDDHSYTVEVVAEVGSGTGALYGYYNNAFYGISLGSNNRVAIFTKTETNYVYVGWLTLEPGLRTVVNRQAVEELTLTGFVDGESVGTKSFDSSRHGSFVRVGANSPTGAGSYQPYTGRLHALRIYDRALTNEEIKHNHSIDKRRFGL